MPGCGRHYADASWYIIEMASDIECGSCHANFNTKRNLTDRIMLSLKIGGNGKVEAGDSGALLRRKTFDRKDYRGVINSNASTNHTQLVIKCV